MQKTANRFRALLAAYAIAPFSGRTIIQNLPAIRSSEQGSRRRIRNKIIFAMKLSALLLTAAFTQVFASGAAQSVTLKGKDLELKEIFMAVKEQTGYVVFYSSKTLLNTSRPVSLSVQNMPLKDFLDLVIKDQPLVYQIERNTISLSPKNDLAYLPGGIAAPPARVTGVIRNISGELLPSASIRIKNSNNGTATNAQGQFALNDVPENAVLQVSMIGYQTAEIAIQRAGEGYTAVLVKKEQAASLKITDGPAVYINLVLLPSDSPLDEIQVEGYRKTSKRLSTSSIGTINAEAISKQPVSDPLQALQGRIPGLIVTPTSGNFGAKMNIQIRGQNSLNFQTNPLFIVDDVPVSNENFRLGSYSGDLSPFSFINSNDIESISVLKDADATAIYGSRGANGVILITTKKGKMGRTTVNINAQSGFGEVAKKLKLLNTEQYIAMRKEAYQNDGIDYTAGSITSAKTDLLVFDQHRYTDWQKVMIGNKAQYQDFQADIAGGTQTMQYTVGANFHRETTVYPGTNANRRGNMHFSIGGNSPNNKLSVTFTGNYLFDNMNTGPHDFTHNIFFAPNAPALLNDDGSINWAINPATGFSTWSFNGNPYVATLIRHNSKIYNLITGLNVNYEIANGLRLKLVGGYGRLTGNATMTYPATANQPAFATNPTDVAQSRGAEYHNNIQENWSVEPQLTYNFSVKRHNFDLLLGASIQNTIWSSDILGLFGFTSDALLLNRAAASSVSFKENTSAQYKYTAGFFRIGYRWDDKYIVTINGRRDGSSRFAPGNQFGNFGSAGLAWIFSEERFIKEQLPFLSFGKLRYSYGLTGNDQISNYAYMESYSLASNSVTYQNDLGYSSNGAVNPNYHWETVKKMEFALELGFLKDRILLQANYYRNRSDDQLIYYPTPVMAGFGNLYINMPANLRNSGLELMLSTTNIKTPKFSWATAINFTRNRNKLVDYPDIDKSAYHLQFVGQPFYGYDLIHLSAGVNPATGIYQFYDSKGNITEYPEDSYPIYRGPQTQVMMIPKFYGGISNTFIYKNLSLDLFFQYNKQTGYSEVFKTPGWPGYSRTNILAEVYENRWIKPGDHAKYMKLSTTFSYGQYGSTGRSDMAYTDVSFIRLKNFSLGYDLPQKWLAKKNIQKVRIYAQGQNTFTLTKYRGLDPETQDFYRLPPLRVWTMGLQLGF